MEIKELASDRLEEKIREVQLDNGLKLFYMPKKGFSKKYAIFTTKYGSNDNRFVPLGKDEFEDVPEGIAHFLEHKLFEEPEGNIFNEFSKLGSYVNAFTNFNQTAYLFSCTENFYENLSLLIKFVQNPYFTDENVNKEKGIIEQEIKMYDDEPGWKVFFNCLKGMYKKHPVRIDIAGTVESINKITKETLYKCYNTFYHPSNMILFMIGDLDFEKSIDKIMNVMKESPSNNVKEIKRFYSKEPKEINEKYIEESLAVSVPLFNMGFKDLDIGTDGTELLKRNIETEILLEMLFGSSTEFYQYLYDSGLIDNSFGFQYVGHKDYGHSIIGGQSEDPNKVSEEILKYVEKLKLEGLKEELFIRMKNKLMGYHIMDFNSLENIANGFASYYFDNISLFDYIYILEKITLKDVENRLKAHLTKDNYTLSIIYPRKDI
ncbi:EF-P 5-aminopentanol modification-associated protein YfmH [Clostridiisalibacter paucivorans]|uniref:EF-P 5-aminopentanol modification-associated protein YfmH n=1 Tax=Clostridiisalibacter paucivorans TaxID=408753 RepID=UPI000B1DC75F|nr:pitrilysin family protein [Clostridiisalibacter paucivorans]